MSFSIKGIGTLEVKVHMVKEVFSQYFEMAQKKLEGMSLQEKVGQIFLARNPKE